MLEQNAFRLVSLTSSHAFPSPSLSFPLSICNLVRISYLFALSVYPLSHVSHLHLLRSSSRPHTSTVVYASAHQVLASDFPSDRNELVGLNTVTGAGLDGSGIWSSYTTANSMAQIADIPDRSNTGGESVRWEGRSGRGWD